MLSYDVMGTFALLVVWTATLLIVAAAAQDVRDLFARWWALRGSVVHGRARQRIARALLDQVGRAGGDEGSIVFHDRRAYGEVFGGEVETAAGVVILPALDACEVWPSSERSPRDPVGFAQAYEEARKVRGFQRTLVSEVGPGQPLWFSLGPGTPLVAMEDPLAWHRRAMTLSAVAMTTFIGSCAFGTWLVLSTPRFGATAMIGAAYLLAHFLLVQPLGTWLRERVLPPHRRPLRGELRAEVSVDAAEAVS